MGCTWTPSEKDLNVYFKLRSKCSYLGVMKRLSHQFITLLYMMIFEHDPPSMSQEVMETLLNIADSYASPSVTFMRMFGVEKPLHELPSLATDQLVMKEVSYHISKGLLSLLHTSKKAAWPTLSLWIGWYNIHTLRDVDVENKDLKEFRFRTKSFIPYDPHCICKNHSVKVYFPWVHGACHWAEDDP